jgi:LPXTG-site transpeptidase (sortase) family protein
VKPQVYDAPVQRLLIPSIGVDAPIVSMGLTADGALAAPNGPTDVAWYPFTAKPGMGGNAVFSGHVDYIHYGPAVFWDLRKLKAGDTIDVRLTDGTVLQYTVTASKLYPVDQVPMQDVLAQTSTESITLITCGGVFESGEYTDRLVLRAARTGVTKA